MAYAKRNLLAVLERLEDGEPFVVGNRRLPESVYVVNNANQAQPRQIVASVRVGHDWVVDSGLSPGDKVVVEGVAKLRPGAPVKPVLAASETGPTNDSGAPHPQTTTPADAPVAAKVPSGSG